MTIAIDLDFEGLRQAAVEMLEQGLLAQRLEAEWPRLKRARNRDQVLKSYRLGRTLAIGYYVRVGYLVKLERAQDRGVMPRGMSSATLWGLEALARAREEFARKHPGCPHCGAPLENATAFTCWSCRKKTRE